MTRYIVKLTQEEEMAIRQLASQPGFEVIFKFLQGESLDAQTAAMECTDADEKKRLMLLTDAQSTTKIVGSLIRKLAAFQQALIPQTDPASEHEIFGNIWNPKEGAN